MGRFMCGCQLGLGDRIGSFGDGTEWYVGVMAVIWAKCLARILVFLWGGALLGGGGGGVSIFRDYFCGSVSKISFWGVVSYSPGIRSLQLSGSSWGSFDISCLLLIITVRFTCGEKKIW